MIRVTIELVKHGDETQTSHLGTIEIWNDATGTPTRGNYKFLLSRKGHPKSSWQAGMVKDFPRRARNSYDLLYRVLRTAVGERNPQ